MLQPPESDSTTAMETSIDIAMAKDDIAVPQSLSFPPEVWNMIGELVRLPQHSRRSSPQLHWTLCLQTSQIRTRSTLLTLISTCRAFNNLFTPFLRRKFTLELTAIPPSQLRQKPLPPGLHHSRELEVLLEEMRGKEQVLKNYSRSLNHDYVSFVIRLLKETINLQAFRFEAPSSGTSRADLNSSWIDSTYDDTYRPTTMLRNRRLLRALKQSSTIKNVSILFASQYLDDPDDALRCSIPLDGFKNLTSLELYNFFGEPDSLIQDIAIVLAECPDLKTLGLGFACDFDCYNSPEVLILSEEIHFLEKLCEKYGSQPGIRPLVLETLRLGHGIFLFDSVMQGESETNKYLAKLVHLETLRNLYIYNGLVKQDLDDELIESMEVDWDQLEDCKSVRRLSVSRLEIDLVHWLKHGCKCLIEELIVTDHYGMYDDDLDNFNLLRLPRLSMLFIREMTVAERSGDDAWSDTESSATDRPEAETISDAETISEAGSSSNREIALGPGNQSPAYSHSATESVSASEPASETQYMDQELSVPVMSILDRLYDNGAQLTKLGLCLDLETQWVNIFTTW
jgi:hypothetical protein